MILRLYTPCDYCLRRGLRWTVVAVLCLAMFTALGAAHANAETLDTSDRVENVMRLASLGQHEAAVALFERVKKQRPDTIESIHGHKVAVVYAAIGDRERHAAHCRWLMERRRDAIMPTDAERSVKGYLLFPSADDPALIEHALERTRLATDQAEARGEGEYLAWFEGSRGMAEYRSGNHAEAVGWLEKAAKADNLYITSLAAPFQAMAEYARGNHERAEALLTKARELAAQLPAPGTDEYLREWTDTLTSQIALREAERTIAGNTTASHE